MVNWWRWSKGPVLSCPTIQAWMVEAERMYRDVDRYAKVRRAVMVEGLSERGAAKQFGIDRKAVSKMIRHSVPPGYPRKDPPVSPKLDPFVGIVHQILLDDRDVRRLPVIE